MPVAVPLVGQRSDSVAQGGSQSRVGRPVDEPQLVVDEVGDALDAVRIAGRDDEAPLPAPAAELDRVVGVGLAGDDAAVVGELTDPAVLVTHYQ